MYSSYSFTTLALDGGEWLLSYPGHALPLGKGPPVPIVQEVGWPQSRFGHRSYRKTLDLKFPYSIPYLPKYWVILYLRSSRVPTLLTVGSSRNVNISLSIYLAWKLIKGLLLNIIVHTNIIPKPKNISLTVIPTVITATENIFITTRTQGRFCCGSRLLL
jgi:hypothetical protein